jgi:predicted Zn-ribbon and HTH transcriptional regulator
MSRIAFNVRPGVNIMGRMGKKVVQVVVYRCERCGYEWQPRQRHGNGEPTTCPHCRSPYWNKPRRKPKAKS